MTMRHQDTMPHLSAVCLAHVVLHLAVVIEVLEVVVLVLEEDPELALLLLDLGHGLQHHLVSIAVRRRWILIMESSNKPIPKIHHFNLLGSAVSKVEGDCILLVNKFLLLVLGFWHGERWKSMYGLESRICK